MTLRIRCPDCGAILASPIPEPPARTKAGGMLGLALCLLSAALVVGVVWWLL